MKAVILAAGESSRFWPLNQQHKSLIKIMAKPLIWYTLESLERGGIKDLIIVQGPQKDIEKTLGNYKLPGLKINYILQKESKGMGNALWQCRNLLNDSFFVLNAERIDGGEIIKKLRIKKIKTKAKAVLVGQKTDKPEFYGIMRLKKDRVLAIVEKPKKGDAPSNVRVVGAYLLEPDFFNFYSKIKKNIYDFEKTLSLYARKNETRLIIAGKEAPSLKYPWHLFEVEKYLFDRFLKRKIEKTVKIAKNVTIEGKVYIGEGTKIFEGAIIKGPCFIGKNCVIGNNAFIRDYTNLEQGAVIGASAEIKKSILQDNLHFHSGFLGNSIFGINCTIGAGTITANRRIDRQSIKIRTKEGKIDTGLDFFGSIVGENNRIGINTSLMPGVLIGSNSAIGPHSLVMENVGDNKIFYNKFQKIIKKKK